MGAVRSKGECSAFDTFKPFPSFCLLKLVGPNVQGRQCVALMVHGKKIYIHKIKHIFAVSTREGQVYNEGIIEE